MPTERLRTAWSRPSFFAFPARSRPGEILDIVGSEGEIRNKVMRSYNWDSWFPFGTTGLIEYGIVRASSYSWASFFIETIGIFSTVNTNERAGWEKKYSAITQCLGRHSFQERYIQGFPTKKKTLLLNQSNQITLFECILLKDLLVRECCDNICNPSNIIC